MDLDWLDCPAWRSPDFPAPDFAFAVAPGVWLRPLDCAAPLDGTWPLPDRLPAVDLGVVDLPVVDFTIDERLLVDLPAVDLPAVDLAAVDLLVVGPAVPEV